MMKTVKIRLSSIQDVRNFVDVVTRHKVEVDLSSGRYVVDAKSIMGIFSLDLLNPITLSVQTDDAVAVEALLADVKPFIVEE